MTIQQAYQQVLAQLYDVYDNREAANIADLVIEYITGQRKIDRIMYKNIPLNAQQQQQLQSLTSQLVQHCPVQYVLNEAWFAGMKLYVNEHVLIPRPETEELVDWVVSDIKNVEPRRDDKFCILDIGTGSGCIPIAIKKQLPAHVVSALDISDEALEVARKNAAAQQVQINFTQGNFLSPIDWEHLEMFDVITSNPPYIKNSEAAFMAGNVLQYEPHLALFVPDEDALIFYKSIALFAQKHLTPKGNIYVEINEALGHDVVALFNEHGFLNTTLRKDLQGKERMVKAGR